MDVKYFPDERIPTSWRQAVVAIGNFDGVHRGHAKIVDRICRRARETGGVALVLTFEPHPPRVVRPDKAPPLLMTLDQKLRALERAGVSGVAIVRFTRELARWEPDTFVETVIVDWLRAVEVWVGGNFLFGRDRSGNFSLLRTLGQTLSFRVEKIDPVRYKDFVVSSTRVRRLIEDGRVDEAAALLGHHYAVEGRVVPGAGRGRQIGVPTANLETPNELAPAHGVYATVLLLDRTAHPSVTNVGVRPTFGEAGGRTIEAHVLDGTHDLYDRTVSLAFVQRLRDEQAFSSVEALRAQIDRDRDRARRLFGQISL